MIAKDAVASDVKSDRCQEVADELEWLYIWFIIRTRITITITVQLKENTIMSAESMLVNGFILSMVLVLVGLAWGFLILKIQGGEAE